MHSRSSACSDRDGADADVELWVVLRERHRLEILHAALVRVRAGAAWKQAERGTAAARGRIAAGTSGSSDEAHEARVADVGVLAGVVGLTLLPAGVQHAGEVV